MRRIPISISPFFWLFAILLGYINSQTVMGTFIWGVVIFVSVLVHELGHALVALAFGLAPRIELAAFGGMTYYQAEALSRFKQFLVILSGPLFGFLLFIASFLAWQAFSGQSSFLFTVFYIFQWVNLIWTAMNLLPILPLDGGQMFCLLLQAIFKGKGVSYALFSSMAFALMLGLFFLLYSYYLVAAFFFLFAYQNYRNWKFGYFS